MTGLRHVRDMTLSEILARKMVDYGYDTLEAMAEDVGITPIHLSRFMRGERVQMGIKVRQALSRCLDISPAVLNDLEAESCLRGYEMDTLIAYRDHGMRAAETAEALYIHPTTLRYRLLSIKNATGKDPRVWEKLLELTGGADRLTVS